MPSSMLMSKIGAVKQDMVKNLQAAVEFALSKANVLKTTKTETLQAVTMYLVRMSMTITSIVLTLFSSRFVAKRCVEPMA